ncbi:hypothetical protein F3N42_09130 [Marinihelvus fidelis]|uniref:Uncharacterized protein n=1 Tax=Marinihelvus fidelis TaxID=2613842 RepID=A0A5N0T9M5_9GAMM|nr:hypothetical protein [Marinihelvus fidelis]KAA9131471.1 hypothetical protein F3N42_09130 [Marinihelvus fidelis]
MSTEQTNQTHAEAGLYAFDQCKAYPLPDNRILVRNPRSGRQAVLTPDVYSALTACTQFRTLADHAARLASDNPALNGQEGAIVQVLDSVRRDGLLISAQIYATTLGGAVNPRLNSDRPVVAIITWERPDALARCLDSLAGHCELSNAVAFYIIDDSRQAANQARNRETTSAFAERTDTPVRYMGETEQRQYLQQLITAVPAHGEAIRFLADRDRWTDYWTSGLARTMALLVSAGRRLLVLDDDILAVPHEPYRGDGAPAFSEGGREAAFFANDDDWQEFRASDDTDPMLRHLRYLGASLPAALGAMGTGELPLSSFEGATVPFMESLGDDSRVLVTECGSLGDPGTSRLDWITGLDGASMERLLASDDSVDCALSRRNGWSGQSRPTLSPRANMSQFTGLDNRHLLPPYIPVFRGEDRLFGDMTAFVHPGSVALDDAWAVPHKPIPERQWTDADRQLKTPSAFPAFAMDWVRDHADDRRGEEPLARLRRLAQLYADLAELDHEAMVELHTDYLLRARADDYRHLKALQGVATDAPAAWQLLIGKGVERLNRELAGEPVPGPVTGHPENLRGESLTEWWRVFWRDFGRALQAWPAIRQAALRLNGTLPADK